MTTPHGRMTMPNPETSNSTAKLDQTLLHALPIPALLADDLGHIVALNQPLAALLGRSTDELAGKKAWMAFSEKKRATPIELAVRSGEAESDEHFLVRDAERDEQVVVQFSANVVLDAEGNSIGVLGVLQLSTDGVHDMVQDLEELKRAVQG